MTLGSLVSLGTSFLLVLGASTCNAEIYKWVDKNGQTHFSERKEATGAKPVELRADSAPGAPSSPEGAAQYWREQEAMLLERQASKRMAQQSQMPQKPTVPKSLSGGTAKWADSDEWRCNLARDILSGAVQRRMGAIDDQDRKLAAENVRVFCR